MAATSVAIRGLSGRGFRVPVAGALSTWQVCKEGSAVSVDFTDETTRLILSRERDNFVVVTNTGTSTAYLVGLSRRGFRIKNNAGAVVQIVQGAKAQVDLTKGAVLRTLKRQKRDFVRVPSTWTGGVLNIYGLQESQASFRVDNPDVTFAFSGANNDLTFALKANAPDDLTVQLADLGVDNVTIDITNPQGDDYLISLAVTQTAPATAVLSSDGTIPTDGDTVTINDVTYRLEGTISQANDVHRVTSSDVTLDNLVKAVNGTGTVGVDYFAGTAKPTNVTAGARTGTGATGAVTFTAGTGVAAATTNAYPSTEASTHLSFGDTSFDGAADYSIDSTAADVATAVAAASPGLGDLVTVTYEGTGLGKVAPAAKQALEGNDPLPLAKGDTVSVDINDPFNIAQLRRHFRAWVEVL